MRIGSALAVAQGRAERRCWGRRASRRLAAILALCAGAPAPAIADDSQPAQWIIDANAVALQHAPPPPEKPVICIVDYGVNETPDLDIVSRQAIDGGTPDDVSAAPGTYGHGTTVAHMAAGKVNGWGGSGVFPHARIASVRIFPRAGERVPWAGYVSGLERCWEVRPRPVVAILALGGPTADPDEVADLVQVMTRSSERHGISVVAAAGNGGAAADMPARLNSTVSVAAADGRGALCPFSARGQDVDLVAPGCGVVQTGWDGSSWRLDGTSFAAPIVAGLLAALRGYRPDLSAAQAETLLTAGQLRGRSFDAGRVLSTAGIQLRSVQTDFGPTSRATPDGAAEIATNVGDSAASSTIIAPVTGRPLNIGTSRPGRTERMPRPRVRLTERPSGTRFRIYNRPPGSLVDVRIGRRSLSRQSSTFRLKGRVRRARLRFVTDLGPSRWAVVHMRRL